MHLRIPCSPTLLIVVGLLAAQALVAGTDFEVAQRLERQDHDIALRGDAPMAPPAACASSSVDC